MVKLINDFATHECSHGPRKCDCNYLLRTDTFKNICQVLLVLIFIWVLFIVFSQIYYLFYTIYLLSPLHSFYIPFNTSITRHQLLLTSMKWIVAENTKIPCHIHQTWKTNNLSTYPLRNSHERWKAWYPEPECRVTLWTDASLSELIELEYPWLWPTYSSYLHPIQKADIGRLAVLHYYGGIHADLDVDPSVVNFHYLRKFSLVLPRDSADKMVTNHFIMAEKGSKFLNYALYGATGRNVWIFIPYLEIFWSTGPLFISEMLKRYSLIHSEDDIAILDSWAVDAVAHHRPGRSWMQADGKLLYFVSDLITSIPLSIFLFLIIIFGLASTYMLHYKPKLVKNLFKQTASLE